MGFRPASLQRVLLSVVNQGSCTQSGVLRPFWLKLAMFTSQEPRRMGMLTDVIEAIRAMPALSGTATLTGKPRPSLSIT